MDVVALVLAIVFVALNAFFVATEFAIVKVRPTRIEELVRKGRTSALAVRRLTRNIDGYLSATQLGITLASLGLGWIGEPAFARLIEKPLLFIGISDPLWIHRLALALAFAVITFLHIVLGELAPKSLAIMRAESVALVVAYPMRVFYVLFFPVIWTLNSVALFLLRLLGINSKEHVAGEDHSEEEIKIILAQARSAGLLEPSRAELVGKALSLPQKTARHLMVPRSDVVWLDANLSFEENLERAMNSGHTRFALCDRELDDVLGIIDLREALFTARHGDLDLRSIATPAPYVPETMSAERLLVEFRARNLPMAIVVDEYGGASGIVTSADIVTAVMGELSDESSHDVIALPGGTFEVDGGATLEEVETALSVHLATESMRTIAGYLMERLGRMPKQGDTVRDQGYLFCVVTVEGPRVRWVHITRAKTLPP